MKNTTIFATPRYAHRSAIRIAAHRQLMEAWFLVNTNLRQTLGRETAKKYELLMGAPFLDDHYTAG